MWVFYVISLPLTMGMVMLTLLYFAGPDVPRYVLFLVGYTWFCSISVIILVPADLWAVSSFFCLILKLFDFMGFLCGFLMWVPLFLAYNDECGVGFDLVVKILGGVCVVW